MWKYINMKKTATNKNYLTSYAFYYLSGSPATFDIISFLLLADYVPDRRSYFSQKNTSTIVRSHSIRTGFLGGLQ